MEDELRVTALLLLFMMLLTSCGKKNEITPIVGKRSLVQQMGDGDLMEVTLRFPLTESSIDAYEDVTAVDTPLLGGLFSSFNKMFYKMGTTFGLGKMKLRIHQVLPEIDDEYIKEMKITKIFFTVDDTICERPDVDFDLHPICKKKKKRNWWKTLFNFKKDETNFDFVKTAVLQMFPSDAIPAEDTVVSEPSMVYSGFDDLMAKTFPGLFDSDVRSRIRSDRDERRSEREERKAVEKACKNAGFKFNKDKVECSKEITSKARRCIKKGGEFVEGKCEKTKKSDMYTDVSNDDNYDDVFFGRNKVEPIQIGKYYRGKNEVIIGSEYDDMILIKTNDSFNLKRYIKKNEKYNKHVKSMTSIKGVLFLQLKNKTQELKLFMEELLVDIEQFEKDVKVDSVTSCLEGDCIALEVNDVNLIDHLKGKNSVMIDTYLHVKDVPSKTFQLKGFVEFKVKFKMDF